MTIDEQEQTADDATDLVRLRSGRLERLRDQLRKRDLAACVLVDPVNIRYATGARNMQIFHARNPARYLFVPAEGPVDSVRVPRLPSSGRWARDDQQCDRFKRAT